MNVCERRGAQSIEALMHVPAANDRQHRDRDAASDIAEIMVPARHGGNKHDRVEDGESPEQRLVPAQRERHDDGDSGV